MGLRLNELAPALGAKKPLIAVVAVLAQVLVKLVVAVLRVRLLAQDLAFQQVLRAVKCHCIAVCQNLVLPVNLR